QIVTYHSILLFLAAGAPLLLSGVKAVPVPGHLRDLVVAVPVYFLPLLSWRFKKKRWGSPKQNEMNSVVATRDEVALRDLKRQLHILPVPDKTGKLPKDVFAEAGYFLVLAYLPLEAVWRWFSHSPSVATVDWRQVGINSGALLLLIAVWSQIRRLNYR